jgi:hypothetical protein
MHPVLGICPVCGEVLTITRLHCRACDTTIDGQFYAGRLSQLNPDQLQFVETFLQCEGKIKAVEEKLGISYPTVRSRLRDVIHAMGYEVPSEEDETQPSEENRKRVLEELAEGKITSDEAVMMLRGDL